MKESLLILPLEDVTENPSPISTPLTAPIDITALAREASSLSKTGSPTPAGIPSIIHSIRPPDES